MLVERSMKSKNYILLYILLTFVSFSIQKASLNPQMIIQGFYWQGQAEYTHPQRQSLLSQLPPNSTYIYMPQLTHTLTPWNPHQLQQWKQTVRVSEQRKVQLVIGIRPKTIENIQITLKKIQEKVGQLGLPYVLGWDDCPGGATHEQKVLQKEIVGRVKGKPWGIVPGAYYSEDGTIQTWLKGLSIIDEVDSSIPFILCSKNGINPSSFNPSTDFPPLPRKLIFWDNWMAVDSLTRLPRNLPRNRSPKLFSPDSNYGYILNLCFPPQRIIHGISALSYLQKNIQYDENAIANVWTQFLFNHGFIQQADMSEMAEVLYQVVHLYQGTMDVKELIKQYPILGKFLYV